jgi:vancomycin resistance protein YoaR
MWHNKEINPLPTSMKIKTKLLLGLFALVFASTSSLSLPETQIQLSSESSIDTSQQSFQLTLQGQTHTLTLEDIQLQVDINENHRPILNFLQNKDEYGEWTFSWTKALSENNLRQIWEINRPINAYFYEDENGIQIKEESYGPIFDITPLIEELIADYPDLSTYTLESQNPELILSSDLEPHQALLQSLTTEGFIVTEGENTHAFPAQLKDIKFIQSSTGVDLSFSDEFLSYLGETLQALTKQDPTDLILTTLDSEFSQENTPQYLNTSGSASDGKELQKEVTQSAVQNALSNGQGQVEAQITNLYGKIINETGQDLGKLTSLSTGLSNFSGSGSGRIHNVKKGLNEHMNGILIPNGAEFKFNSYLGGAVTYSKGWQGAYAIIGGDLITVPGGGICQVSTTVYRAALNAGLEITSQRNHSLYVSYYQAYGDGLDATIYPGSQDLIFTNNTGSPILMLASYDEWDAEVQFYGTPDGRNTELYGPFTQSNQPESLTSYLGGSLGRGQIAWKQEIAWPNGEFSEEWLISSYKSYVPQY